MTGWSFSNIGREILPAIFSASWLYFFSYSCIQNYLDRKTLLAIPLSLLVFAGLLILNAKLIFLNLPNYFLSFVFICAILGCTILDLVEMTVPRICSIWLAPFWIFFAQLSLLQINSTESLIAGIFGFCIPWGIAVLYKKFSGKDGLGFGDVELLTMIGTFLGITKIFSTLYIASFSCLILSLALRLTHNINLAETKIPFAPFLALGALLSFILPF